MKLLSLKVENFRQFFGEREMTFAAGQKSVTVVIGNNGFGKTTLLNAIVYALYGSESFTPAFEDPEHLVNDRAIQEAKVGQSVQSKVVFDFSHNFGPQKFKYRITRTCKGTKKNSKELGATTEQIMLATTPPSGNTEVTEDAGEIQDQIDRILPRNLYPYFFLDGERIEKMVSPNKEERKRLALATKQLAGLEVLDRGIRHVAEARKDIDEELGDIAINELKEFMKDKIEKENELEELKKEILRVNTEMEANNLYIEEIDTKLKGKKEVGDLQKRRERLQLEKIDLEEQSGRLIKKQTEFLSRSAYKLYCRNVCADFIELVDKLKKKGELPAGIKRKFVLELIESKRCICGAELGEGGTHLGNVKEWLNKGGMHAAEAELLTLSGQIDSFSNSISGHEAEYGGIVQERKRIERSKVRIDSDLEGISAKLGDGPFEDIKLLEKKRNELLDRKSNYEVDLSQKKHRVKDFQIVLEKIRKNIAEAEGQAGEAVDLMHMLDIANRTEDALKLVRSSYEGELKEKLESKMGKIFSNIFIKSGYTPRLEDDFTPKLTYPVGAVSKSGGENQILTISFIGAIIEVTKSKTADLDGEDGSTVEYPVVVDSPFGQLDTTNKSGVAKALTAICDQAIVFVSNEQWSGQAMENLEPVAGKIYLLKYTANAEIKDPNLLKLSSVVVRGKNLKLVDVKKGAHDYYSLEEVGGGK